MDLRPRHIYRPKYKDHDELIKFFIKNVPSLSKSKQSTGHNSDLPIHPVHSGGHSIRHNNDYKFWEHAVYLRYWYKCPRGLDTNVTFLYRASEHNDPDFIDCFD